MRSVLKRTIFLAAAAGFLLGAGACGRNRAGLLLSPTGTPPGPPAVAAITGQLDFGSTDPHPLVLVMVARVRGTVPSTFNTMELAGSFTNPTWTLPSAANPKLTQFAPKVWADTLVMPSGAIQWKFAGDSDWNRAYMSALSGSEVDGLSGTLLPSTPGGKNLIANVLPTEAGTCVCTVDENATPVTYAIQKVGAGAPAVFSGTDGRFTITGLVAGTYNVLFRVPGQTPFTLTDVVVGNSMKDLGVISTSGQNYVVSATAGLHGLMVPTGELTLARGASQHFSLVPEPHYRVDAITLDGTSVSTDTAYTLTNITADHTIEASFIYNTATLPGGIHAALAYDPSTLPITTTPYPPTTAKLYWGTELLDSLLIPTSGTTLDLSDLDQATYRLTLSSPLYPIVDLPVTVGGGVTDLGTLNMVFDFNLLASTINVAGDFNGWSASALSADLNGELAWTVTTSTPITAGVHDLKFARYGGFVDEAYGGDPGTTLSVPVANQPTRLVTGGGTSTNAIRVDFPATSNYTFTIDERRQVINITAAPAPQSSPRR
jgi:hypothetical protein